MDTPPHAGSLLLHQVHMKLKYWIVPAVLLTSCLLQAQDHVIPLWPGNAPGAIQDSSCAEIMDTDRPWQGLRKMLAGTAGQMDGHARIVISIRSVIFYGI